MANNEDTLMREVEEELRRERMEQLWKTYGSYFLAAAVALVMAVAGYKFYQSQQLAAANSAGQAYEEEIALIDEKKPDEARKALADITKNAPDGYQALARLRLAALEAEAGEKAKAAVLYEELASSSNADPLLKSFAKLQAASLKIGEAGFTEVENRLNDLAADASPWRAAARELIALAAFKAGKHDVARRSLEQILADRTAPNDVRERAQVIMAEIISAELANAAGQAPKADGAPKTETPAEAAPSSAPAQTK